MSESTPISEIRRVDTDRPDGLILPAAAVAIWAELLPDPPADGARMIERSKRRTGPPSVLYTGPGAPPSGRTMYRPAEVREWCLSRQAARARQGLRLLELIERHTTGGVGVELRPPYTDSPRDHIWIEVGEGFGEAVEAALAELALPPRWDLAREEP